eukprot:jgi/Ulvmu1/6454/UM003_0084.1
MALVVKCPDGSSFSALGRVQVGRGEHGFPAVGAPEQIFEFSPIPDSEDTAQLRVIGEGVEIVVENMPPDSGDWGLMDHLCMGEAALLRCDGRWRFRVTAPAAAAGCAFVCDRAAHPPVLPPLAPAPPHTSPLDMLLEASRVQPQASQARGSTGGSPSASPAVDTSTAEPHPHPLPRSTGGLSLPGALSTDGGAYSDSHAARAAAAQVPDGAVGPHGVVGALDAQDNYISPTSPALETVAEHGLVPSRAAAIDESTWKEMGFSCEAEARLVLGDATFDGTPAAAQHAGGRGHEYVVEDGQAPRDSFNISADAVHDTDGSGPVEDPGSGEDAQSQLVKRLYPGGAPPQQPVTTGTVATAPPLVRRARVLAPGAAEKRGVVRVPSFQGALGPKRARVNGVETVAETGEDEETGEYEESPVALMWIRMKMPWPFNHGCFGVKLRQVVCGNIELAIVSNYMMDVKWLMSACPDLRRARRLVLLHGEARGRMRGFVDEAGLSSSVQVTVHAPPLPIPYGTHHSKFFILKYTTGVRVIIHTANLIFCDCNNKTQGLYYQDFPLLPAAGGGAAAADFGATLLQYIRRLALPAEVHAAVHAAVSAADYGSARVALVPSVPGRHTGAALTQFGHMRVHTVLARHAFPATFCKAPIACQFSSLGSLTQPWLEREFATSLSAGRVLSATGVCTDVTLGPPAPPPGAADADARSPALQLIWPTQAQIAGSFEGWSAGLSVPGYAHNVRKPFLRALWSRWGAALGPRSRAMPHIKSFCRYSGDEVAWFLLGSHNLSKAAWGELQKERTSLFIRSYELGVLCLPELEAAYRGHPHRGFSCTAAAAAARERPLLRCPRSAMPRRCAGTVAAAEPPARSTAAAAAAPRQLQRTPSDVSTGQYGRWSGFGEPTSKPGERKVHRGMLYKSSGSLVDLSSAGDGSNANDDTDSTKADAAAATASCAAVAATGADVCGSPARQPPARSAAAAAAAAAEPPQQKRVAFVIAGCDAAHAAAAAAATNAAAAAAAPTASVEYVPVPLPYTLPPQPYGAADMPWTVDEDPSPALLDTHGLRRDEAVGGMYGYLQDTVQPYFQDNN